MVQAREGREWERETAWGWCRWVDTETWGARRWLFLWAVGGSPSHFLIPWRLAGFPLPQAPLLLAPAKSHQAYILSPCYLACSILTGVELGLGAKQFSE